MSSGTFSVEQIRTGKFWLALSGDMGWRFLSELTLADSVTLANAGLGFIAVVLAPTNPELAARVILLAAVTDGIDGIIARHLGGSAVGPYLDSLADVSSFAIAPAVLLYVSLETMEFDHIGDTLTVTLALGVSLLFISCAVLRLGFYSAYDTAATKTVGAPTTLAATILAASLLTLHAYPNVLIIGGIGLALAMIAPITYPDLLARDALLMGAIHIMAVVQPLYYGRIFPYALVTLALAYLVLGPWLYWGESERRLRPPSSKGKRS